MQKKNLLIKGMEKFIAKMAIKAASIEANTTGKKQTNLFPVTVMQSSKIFMATVKCVKTFTTPFLNNITYFHKYLGHCMTSILFYIFNLFYLF